MRRREVVADEKQLAVWIELVSFLAFFLFGCLFRIDFHFFSLISFQSNVCTRYYYRPQVRPWEMKI